VYLPQQVDAVFDNVGAATRKHSMKNVRTGGTIVVSGATTEAKPEAMLRRVFFVDSISVHGSYASTLQEFKSMLTFVTTRGIKPDRQRSPDGSGGRRFPPSLER
jgi:D-arabinose 1-dehydrogenase-like Zn-dependent alcohol dehydrogenase